MVRRLKPAKRQTGLSALRWRNVCVGFDYSRTVVFYNGGENPITTNFCEAALDRVHRFFSPGD
jgi:hypothetical protein